MRNKLANMDFEQLLRIVRHAKPGNPFIYGEVADYLLDRLYEERIRLVTGDFSTISNRVGYGNAQE